MKIQVISDLHLDHFDYAVTPKAEYLLVAGDFGDGISFARNFLEKTAPLFKKVFFTLGNHDYAYNTVSLSATERELQFAISSMGNVVFLNNSHHVEEGKLIYGGVMWTKYWGNCIHEVHAQRYMPEFGYTVMSPGVRITPQHIAEQHAAFRRGLAETYSTQGNPDLIVSHHMPSEMSVATRFMGYPLNPAFVEPMQDCVRAKTLWVHGHTHDGFDYIEPKMHNSRIVCNPRGYTSSYGPEEIRDRGFKPDLCIEI